MHKFNKGFILKGMSMLPITFVLFLFFNLASTLLLTGIVYALQFSQYPLFQLIPDKDLPAYVYRHQHLLGFLISPLMLVEAITAAWLALDPRFFNLHTLFYTGLFLVGVIWASTFFLQAPSYYKLLARPDQSALRFLVRSNWIRTLAWTLRSALMLYALSTISDQCLLR